MIALSTTVSLLFTDDKDKMNGLIGSMNGASFALTSIFSGLAIGFLGMSTSLIIAIIFSLLSLLHLITISIPEPDKGKAADETLAPQRIDITGTLKAVREVPGLFALIFFTTFNNFLGGVFMALMDAYGLSLMSVQAWGFMLSLMSIGFILGGIYIARYGLSANPLKRILVVNVITWTTCIFFVIQPSITLLGIGMLIWMTLFPFIEAAEHTVVQKVIPYERQGRVFGFAQSVESAATPVTAFMIGPITQFLFIPFMTTGVGVSLIGDWFGTGADRGIALVFITAGFIGLVVTLLAFRSTSYRLLSKHFTNS
jgi:DHA3 family multidrug efflux protein-like MFS transporter